MSNYQHDVAGFLSTWPSEERHIFHLHELDPTHVAAQPSGNKSTAARQSTQQTYVPSSYCLLAEQVRPVVLLELDPTHLHAR